MPVYPPVPAPYDGPEDRAAIGPRRGRREPSPVVRGGSGWSSPRQTATCRTGGHTGGRRVAPDGSLRRVHLGRSAGSTGVDRCGAPGPGDRRPTDPARPPRRRGGRARSRLWPTAATPARASEPVRAAGSGRPTGVPVWGPVFTPPEDVRPGSSHRAGAPWPGLAVVGGGLGRRAGRRPDRRGHRGRHHPRRQRRHGQGDLGRSGPAQRDHQHRGGDRQGAARPSCPSTPRGRRRPSQSAVRRLLVASRRTRGPG